MLKDGDTTQLGISEMNQVLKSIAAAAVLFVATSASASHIFITNPTINVVALENSAGWTNPTINMTVGGSFDLTAGFLGEGDYWNMTFGQTSGNLYLNNTATFIGENHNGTGYYTFSQIMNTVGTWTGTFQPISSSSCPSYLYQNGNFGGSGCGSPSEYIPFSLVVSAASNPVPVPGSLALIGLGLAGFAAARRKS